MFTFPCYLGFGSHLNKPIVGVITSGFPEWLSSLTGNPYNPSFMPGIFQSLSQRMTFWERLQNTVLTNLIAGQIISHMNKQSDFVRKYLNIDAEIPDLHRNVAAILVNSHYSINGINPTTPGVIEVGGLHINENSDPLSPVSERWFPSFLCSKNRKSRKLLLRVIDTAQILWKK